MYLRLDGTSAQGDNNVNVTMAKILPKDTLEINLITTLTT